MVDNRSYYRLCSKVWSYSSHNLYQTYPEHIFFHRRNIEKLCLASSRLDVYLLQLQKSSLLSNYLQVYDQHPHPCGSRVLNLSQWKLWRLHRRMPALLPYSLLVELEEKEYDLPQLQDIDQASEKQSFYDVCHKLYQKTQSFCYSHCSSLAFGDSNAVIILIFVTIVARWLRINDREYYLSV